MLKEYKDFKAKYKVLKRSVRENFWEAENEEKQEAGSLNHLKRLVIP